MCTKFYILIENYCELCVEKNITIIIIEHLVLLLDFKSHFHFLVLAFRAHFETPVIIDYFEPSFLGLH